ncbi:MAG TPA: NAD-dependent epimerase/dehydratase family protein [Bacteroidetes bacterium]|nr:NAD-dependent epimerase/dehydratase family protein [Bacteroidota bacterium]
MFNLEKFINKFVTRREDSLFKTDLETYATKLNHEVKNTSVLVIGGAGTIGSSFVKAILAFKPKKLYIVDINENGLTELTRDLRSSRNVVVPQEYKTYPIDFGSKVFMKMLNQEGPFDIVANFAAHKHVRSEKDHVSIIAMIENNVIKAKGLLDQLVMKPPKHFFCVSTDKAANPVNVMGASKKLMEEVILAYSSKMKITTARFANVAFSNGSLPFGFLFRLQKKQPLSAPLDVKRYFVSPEESGQLCMIACLLGNSGEIFYPKLSANQMLTFSSIAEYFLLENGYQPFYCQSEKEAKQMAFNMGDKSSGPYPVYFFKSETSGEKPYEEFFTSNEQLDVDRFAQLGVIQNAPKQSIEIIDSMFEKLFDLFDKDLITKTEVVKLLKDIIPSFNHIETGKSLDQKM